MRCGCHELAAGSRTCRAAALHCRPLVLPRNAILARLAHPACPSIPLSLPGRRVCVPGGAAGGRQAAAEAARAGARGVGGGADQAVQVGAAREWDAHPWEARVVCFAQQKMVEQVLLASKLGAPEADPVVEAAGKGLKAGPATHLQPPASPLRLDNAKQVSRLRAEFEAQAHAIQTKYEAQLRTLHQAAEQHYAEGACRVGSGGHQSAEGWV